MAAAPGDSAVSENMESWHTCIMDPRKQNCSRLESRAWHCSSEPCGALGGWCAAAMASHSQAIGAKASSAWNYASGEGRSGTSSFGQAEVQRDEHAFGGGPWLRD